jgi:hypothetical protein
MSCTLRTTRNLHRSLQMRFLSWCSLDVNATPYPLYPFEGIQCGYASAKQNFPRKIGTAAVRDHGITTRRADAAELSRCRQTR